MRASIAGLLLSQGPAILALAMLLPESSTPPAPREPLEYFSEMMPVFTHARCINCHGAVNPTTGAAHGGGVITTESCTSGCHDQADNDNRTGLDDWNLP